MLECVFVFFTAQFAHFRDVRARLLLLAFARWLGSSFLLFPKIFISHLFLLKSKEHTRRRAEKTKRNCSQTN